MRRKVARSFSARPVSGGDENILRRREWARRKWIAESWAVLQAIGVIADAYLIGSVPVAGSP
ncbi:MAG: hypothetical protein RMJ19_11265 [Gemmatales bacterium]|nr:hypothetical protein [Gemmatales bacterium]MDW8176243.1 hypothetical protein [Gemmatales bacterium]